MVLVCSKDHPLSGRRCVSKEQLRELKYVSLFQSSTVKAIKNTLTEHHIQWQSLQVVLVSLVSYRDVHQHLSCTSSALRLELP